MLSLKCLKNIQEEVSSWQKRMCLAVRKGFTMKVVLGTILLEQVECKKKRAKENI